MKLISAPDILRLSTHSITWCGQTAQLTTPVLVAHRPRGTSIYTARIKNSDQVVFIKQEQRPGSYVQERQALLRLARHSSDCQFCPRLYGYSDKAQLFILEQAPGQHFANFYHDTGASAAVRYQAGIRLLNAFQSLHDHGIAHFDTHEENIFYEPETTRLTLIDYGSCGIGSTIDVVHLAKLRSPLCESKKRFYRAPELTQRLTINGELAERYGIASQIYSLVWGLQPLDDAHLEANDCIDVLHLWETTTRLKHYDSTLHEPLLKAILANFHPYKPLSRRYDNRTIAHLFKKALAQ